MQEQSGLARSQSGLTTSSIEKSIILKEQRDKKELLKHLVYLLNRIAKLYQIPNFDNENSVLLASWIYETYQYDQFETIERALTNPKPLDDNAFRLTPDTVAKWLSIELEKGSIKLETEHKKLKAQTIEFTIPKDQEPFSEETNKLIQDFINGLANHQKTPPITEAMIKELGKERLKPNSVSAGHLVTDKDEVIMHELRRQWMIKYHDLQTGKPLDNYLSFEEFILL